MWDEFCFFVCDIGMQTNSSHAVHPSWTYHLRSRGRTSDNCCLQARLRPLPPEADCRFLAVLGHLGRSNHKNPQQFHFSGDGTVVDLHMVITTAGENANRARHRCVVDTPPRSSEPARCDSPAGSCTHKHRNLRPWNRRRRSR